MHAERNWNSLRKFCLPRPLSRAQQLQLGNCSIDYDWADWRWLIVIRHRTTPPCSCAALSLAYAIAAIWAHLHGHWTGTHTHFRTQRVISLWPAVCVQRGKRLSNGVWRLVGQSVNCISWPGHASSSSSLLLMNIIIIIIITSLRL